MPAAHKQVDPGRCQWLQSINLELMLRAVRTLYVHLRVLLHTRNLHSPRKLLNMLQSSRVGVQAGQCVIVAHATLAYPSDASVQDLHVPCVPPMWWSQRY